MRDNRDKQPEKTLEAGGALLNLADLHSEQKLDALTLLVLAAGKAQKPAVAEIFALDSESLCKKLNKPLPFAVARRLGDSERAKEQYAAAIVRYRQALAAPDCDWRLRFGTELTLIKCLNAEKKWTDVITFCDSVIARQEDAEHVDVLKGDFRLRKLEALRNLGETESMLAVYRELLASNASDNAKLGGVISIVVFYRSQNEPDKALAEGQIGLALKKTYPGLLNKLKMILKQIEDALKTIEGSQ
jgi:tetratricopeptide (TPR) repeat protein